MVDEKFYVVAEDGCSEVPEKVLENYSYVLVEGLVKEWLKPFS